MQAPLLVCVGTSVPLNYLRCSVLATRYQVTCVSSLADLRALVVISAPSILVVCHTLSLDESHEAIQSSRKRWPGLCVLGVVAPLSARNPDECDSLVGSLDGPLAMLRAVDALLHRTTPSTQPMPEPCTPFMPPEASASTPPAWMQRQVRLSPPV